LPKIGGGMALATELLLPNAAIKNLIREDKVHQIYNQMQVGRSKSAMHTLNQSLYELASTRKVRTEDAITQSPDPDELRQMLQGGGGGPAIKR
jgi:twitching motility protein PilT